MNNSIKEALFLLLLAGFIGCFKSTEVAGGTSETSNGDLQASIHYADGSRAAHVRVLLIKDQDWLGEVDEGRSVILDSAFSDATGSLRIKVPESIRCNLQIDAIAQGLLFRNAKAVEAGSKPIKLTLAPHGSVSGHLVLDSGTSVSEMRMSGTAYGAVVNPYGEFEFSKVPAGTYPLVALRRLNSVIHPQVLQTVEVAAGAAITGLEVTIPKDTVPVVKAPYGDWPHFRKISLALPGTVVKDTLENFPFLIRLDSGNFDFSQCDGRNIRFTDKAGAPLPYQVAGYEPTNLTGEIWVSVRLMGTNNSDSINMYWGKPEQPDSSDAQKVFKDYSGVWHLSGYYLMGGNINSFSFTAALPGSKDGLGSAIPGQRALSAIGTAAVFSKGDSILIADHPQLRPAKTFTLSAWIRPSQLDTGGSEILSMADNFGIRLLPTGRFSAYIFGDSLWTEGMPIPSTWKTAEMLSPNLVDSTWHHVALVYDGTYINLVLDGTGKVSARWTGKLLHPNKGGLWIGRRGNGKHGYDFKGRLDEVRISPLSLSDAHLNAQYQNQKP